MHDFTPIPALVGGALIGLAASLLLMTHGKVAGISGIFGLLFHPQAPDRAYRLSFLGGLVATGIVARLVRPDLLGGPVTGGLGMLAIAGLAVGFGTRTSGGCTSGHGVCGVSRLSIRSIVATATFVATGMITTYVLFHVMRGGQ